jgi:phage terminase small subunit
VFARAYVQTLNAAAAYRVAFPNAKRTELSDAQVAYQVRAEPWVASRIEELLRERYASMDLKAEQIIRALVAAAFLDAGDLFEKDGSLKPVGDMPDYVRRCIDSIDIEERYTVEKTNEIDNDTGEVKERVTPVRVVTKKVKLASRMSALQMLAKHQGLLDDRVKLTLDGPHEEMDEAALAARVAGIIEAARVRRLAAKDGEDLV